MRLRIVRTILLVQINVYKINLIAIYDKFSALINIDTTVHHSFVVCTIDC